jgi:hypothetical protein
MRSAPPARHHPGRNALDGYGGRTDVSLGVHDPLFARALYLDDGTTRVALVVCDLIGIGSFLSERARELIAERPGIPPTHVMVAATHTHAGPGGVRGRGEPVLAEEIARKVAGAVRVAERNATEGVLKYGFTELSSIAQNRRRPDGPIDRRLDVLAADTPEGANIATVARRCHATTLERDNLEITAEFRARRRTIEQTPAAGAPMFQRRVREREPGVIRRTTAKCAGSTVVGAKAAAFRRSCGRWANHQAQHPLGELTDRPVDAGRWFRNDESDVADVRGALQERAGGSNSPNSKC